MSAIHEEWLKLTREEAIEPDIEICDTHHHLWYGSGDDYTLNDFLADVSGGHRVTKSVFIESGKMFRKTGPPGFQPVGETEFVHRVVTDAAASKTSVASGIVGFADLTLGEAVSEVLEAHIRASPRFRGVRYMTTWDASGEFKISAPKGILLSSRLRAGFARLREYGLSFDAWLYHPQLPDLVDLAQAFPDTTIIVDHTGGLLGIGPYSGRRQEVFQEWQRSVSALSKCANVYMKLGGFGMEIWGFGWQNRPSPPDSLELASAIKPYFLYCVEQFGVQRCMFESNFPVDKRSYSYTVLWNAFKRLTKGFSKEEHSSLFYNTAVKAYRL